MADGGEIRLTLPPGRRFRPVANLVLGGIALRRELSVEALDDLQLALGALLDRAGGADEVSVSFALDEGAITARVGPLDLAGGLDGPGAGLDLRRMLAALVDAVALEGAFVSLVKATA